MVRAWSRLGRGGRRPVREQSLCVRRSFPASYDSLRRFLSSLLRQVPLWIEQPVGVVYGVDNNAKGQAPPGQRG